MTTPWVGGEKSEVIYRILSPVTGRDERSAALTRFAEIVWQTGWDACSETLAEAVATIPAPVLSKADVIALCQSGRR